MTPADSIRISPPFFPSPCVIMEVRFHIHGTPGSES